MIRIGWVVKSVAQWGTMDSIVKTRRAGASQESFEPQPTFYIYRRFYSINNQFYKLIKNENNLLKLISEFTKQR